MYNKYLESFIITADCGSLAKASEMLYITPTAIMKQINHLENELGMVLFERSNKGLKLSEAGKLIYEDAKYIIQFSKESVARAQRMIDNRTFCIRIGTSLMNPSTEISGILQDIASHDSRFQFHIIPFDDYRENYSSVISHLGERIDVIAGIYGFSSWTKHMHNSLPLSEEPICIAVSQTHRLAQKSEINIEDLYGETLYITEPGDSEYLDALRQDLLFSHPQIRLILMKSFDIVIFNQCESTDIVLLTTPMWGILHPMLKTVKVNWDYTVPYGLIYPLTPSEGVKEFVKQVSLYSKS